MTVLYCLILGKTIQRVWLATMDKTTVILILKWLVPLLN